MFISKNLASMSYSNGYQGSQNSSVYETFSSDRYTLTKRLTTPAMEEQLRKASTTIARRCREIGINSTINLVCPSGRDNYELADALIRLLDLVETSDRRLVQDLHQTRERLARTAEKLQRAEKENTALQTRLLAAEEAVGREKLAAASDARINKRVTNTIEYNSKLALKRERVAESEAIKYKTMLVDSWNRSLNSSLNNSTLGTPGRHRALSAAGRARSSPRVASARARIDSNNTLLRSVCRRGVRSPARPTLRELRRPIAPYNKKATFERCLELSEENADTLPRTSAQREVDTHFDSSVLQAGSGRTLTGQSLAPDSALVESRPRRILSRSRVHGGDPASPKMPVSEALAAEKYQREYDLYSSLYRDEELMSSKFMLDSTKHSEEHQRTRIDPVLERASAAGARGPRAASAQRSVTFRDSDSNGGGDSMRERREAGGSRSIAAEVESGLDTLTRTMTEETALMAERRRRQYEDAKRAVDSEYARVTQERHLLAAENAQLDKKLEEIGRAGDKVRDAVTTLKKSGIKIDLDM